MARHLGRPPLLGFDSIEDAGWPGTGLWEKGKASLGLIQALQSLPLPVFVSPVHFGTLMTAVENTKRLLRLQPASCPSEIFACALLHSPSTNSSPLHQLSTTFWLRSNPITARGDRYLQRTFDLVFDFVLASEALASLAKSSLAFEFITMADLGQQPQDVVPQQQGQAPLVGQSTAPLTNSAGENLQCQWQGCGERCSTPETLYVSTKSPLFPIVQDPNKKLIKPSGTCLRAPRRPQIHQQPQPDLSVG